MLGPIGSELMSIFRLLTPAEIDRYLDHSAKSRKIEGTMAANGQELVFDEHDPAFVDVNQKDKKQKFSKEHQAEIIPLHPDQEEDHDNLQNFKEAEELEQDSSDIEVDSQLEQAEKLKNKLKANGLESIGILSAASLRKIEEDRLKSESKKRDSTTAFLIKQREKMRSSKRRLIEQHAYKSYQSNAAQEFYDTEESIDEEDSLSTKGILVNKKQF